MELMPPEVAATVPPLYSQEKVKDPLCVVKFFNPCGSGTWWIIEYDPKERLAFGYCMLNDPDCAELGYVSIDELESLKFFGGALGIERDLHWTPIPLSQVQDAVRRKA